MRKLFIPLTAVFLFTAIFIFSCKRDQFTENDALLEQAKLDSLNKNTDSISKANEAIRDSLNHAGGVIQYSINVVDGSDAGFTKSTNGKNILDSCKVTVSQYGKVVTKVTASDGIAVFSDLRIGAIAVNIQKTGYTSVDFVAELEPIKDTIVMDTSCDCKVDYYNIFRYASTMLPIFTVEQPSASTVMGRLTYESDMTNSTPEQVIGAEVIATIDVDDPVFIFNFLDKINNATYTGKIVEIAYGSAVMRTTSDLNGDFKVDVPSTADGLPIRIDVSEFAEDQTLLMNTLYGIPTWGKQQVRAIFSSTTSPSVVPVVPGAYVTFSAPTGTPAEEPDVAATATAVLTNSGIESVNITDAGNFYTQTPILKVSAPSATEGNMAKVHAVLTNGKVTDVVIDDPGSGYTPSQNVTVSEDGNYSPQGAYGALTAEGKPKITYSIVQLKVTNATTNIYNASTPPNIIITSAAGSGATGQAVMSGYADDITLTNGGSGYVCTPDIVVESSPTGNPTDDATASVDMTDYNPLFRIDYIATTPAKYETTPPVEVRTTGAINGGGATAVAILKTLGNVKQINLVNPGSGYDQNVPPAVYISGGDGTGASAYATVANDGTISAITIGDIGFGYTSANPPTVTIAAPPSGGTTATASVVLEFELDRIDLTNPGAGYDVTYDKNTGSDTHEPTVLVNNVALVDADVTVYPNMSVEGVSITVGGNYYTSAPAVTIKPACGAGSGATATISLKYHLDHINMITKGSGYESPNSDIKIVVETPPEGCPNQATVDPPVLGGAVLESIEITDAGINYSAAPMVKLITGGNDAGPKITATVSGGSITGFMVNDGAISRPYYDPTSFPVSTFNVEVKYFTSPATFAANANPLSGQIEFINVTDPGKGYKSVPLVEMVRSGTVSSGNFVDAQATAIVKDGRVTAINITNPGSGYYSTPTINIIVKNYVETAKGACIINYGTGRITGVSLTAPTTGVTQGAGYITAPVVTFTANLPGVGDGATGIAVIDNGAVSRVIMTNQGQGYLGKNVFIGGASTVPTVTTFPLPGTTTVAGKAYTTGVDGNTFKVYSGKNYVKDIYMGTGFRPVND